MAFYARVKDLPISPQKMGLVLDLVRGRTVTEARRILESSPKKATRFVLKALSSAVAAAQGSGDTSESGIWRVVEARADKAAVLKRWRARARGRGDRIIKRRTNLTIGVDRDLSS